MHKIGLIVLFLFCSTGYADSWFGNFEINMKDVPTKVFQTALEHDPACKSPVDAGKHPGTEIYAIDCGQKQHNIQADGKYVGIFKYGEKLSAGAVQPTSTTPAVAAPAVATPAVATPAVAAPAVATPAVATPAVATPAPAAVTAPASVAGHQPASPSPSVNHPKRSKKSKQSKQ